LKKAMTRIPTKTSTFTSHMTRVVSTASGRSLSTLIALSGAASAAKRPPIARIEVEEKKATPFSRLPMMLVSTMRFSRRSMTRIH
jgi:hypothetical protein